MITQYLYELLSQWEILEDFDICSGFLGKGKSLSVSTPEASRVKKSYTDGEEILSREFTLLLRLPSDREKNFENSVFLERLCNEISEYREEDNELFSQFFDGELVEMNVLEGPQRIGDDIHSIRYEINCELVYVS